MDFRCQRAPQIELCKLKGRLATFQELCHLSPQVFKICNVPEETERLPTTAIPPSTHRKQTAPYGCAPWPQHRVPAMRMHILRSVRISHACTAELQNLRLLCGCLLCRQVFGGFLELQLVITNTLLEQLFHLHHDLWGASAGSSMPPELVWHYDTIHM
eukprot:2722045-Amphidinium_carterae.1